MSILEAVILGLIQGLTEFLPVSSSGHLEIAKTILDSKNIPNESMLMTIVLHGATALSTIVVFKKDIYKIFSDILTSKVNNSSFFSLKILLSMIPAILVGFFLQEEIESLFSGNLFLVGSMLIVTALILLLADRAKNTNYEVTFTNSIIIGLAQAIAIIPGISRSGATISTSVLLGVDKEKSARFAFLMVVPLIFGVMAKELLFGEFVFNKASVLPLLIGFFVACVTGIIACKWMIRLVKNSKLKYFSLYCFIIGIIAIIYS